MACANPFELPHSYRTPLGNILNFSPYLVPCGWCVNCIQDKINYISDRANYELCTRLTGAFVTFTYDDVHLLTNCLPKSYFPEELPDIIRERRFSVNRRDVSKFIDSIRHYIKEHPEIQNVLCQPDFSYMYCTEYGDCFNRPHVHIVFFGLDFAYCKKIIFERWKNGLIDVLPILDGCIRYVCKYISKQVRGVLAYDLYDSKFIERPKLCFSVGFGKGLLNDNIKDIKSHNFTYACGRGLRRPVSAYWKSLIDPVAKRDHWVSDRATVVQMRSYHLKDFSRKGIESFRRKRAQIREANLKNILRSDGIPVAEYEDLFRNKYTSLTVIRSELKKMSPNGVRLLANEYINNLIKECGYGTA